jgi:hypothetical protein
VTNPRGDQLPYIIWAIGSWRLVNGQSSPGEAHMAALKSLVDELAEVATEIGSSFRPTGRSLGAWRCSRISPCCPSGSDCRGGLDWLACGCCFVERWSSNKIEQALICTDLVEQSVAAILANPRN